MNEKKLYGLWGGLFILCAILGFIQDRSSLLKAVMLMLELAFFVPPAILLYQGIRRKERQNLQRILMISAASLILTLVLLVANILSALLTARGNTNAAYLVGDILNGILTVVSSPMMCTEFWALSLFLWACLMMVCVSYWKKTKKS